MGPGETALMATVLASVLGLVEIVKHLVLRKRNSNGDVVSRGDSIALSTIAAASTSTLGVLKELQTASIEQRLHVAALAEHLREIRGRVEDIQHRGCAISRRKDDP